MCSEGMGYGMGHAPINGFDDCVWVTGGGISVTATAAPAPQAWTGGQATKTKETRRAVARSKHLGA